VPDQKKPLPDHAGDDIRGPFVPDDPEYPEWAHGQLEAILWILRERGEPMSENQIEAECRKRKVTFTNGSISAQIRNLRKPANGGFCVLTHKASETNGTEEAEANKPRTPTLYSYVADDHQLEDEHGTSMDQCVVCGFGPYTRLPLYQALHLYQAGVNGDWTEVFRYLRDVLQDRGMLRNAEETDPEPDPEPDSSPDEPTGPNGLSQDLLDFLHEGI
jgi:hypothetical protein